MMSLNFAVYVGPYVVAYGTRGAVEWELLESFDDILINGRGESGINSDRVYVIPNVELGHRESSWDRQESDRAPTEIDEKDVRGELKMMADLANTFIAAVESAGGTCEVKWGVVCGMM